jgi:hypothetical protein
MAGYAMRRQNWILALAAVALVAACLFFAFYVPQTPGRMDRPTARLIPRLEVWDTAADMEMPGLTSRYNVALLLVIFWALGFGAYGLAVAVTWRNGGGRAAVVIAASGATLAALVSVFAMPTVNTDIYNYMVSARVASEYEQNPHYVAPDRFPSDPIYPYASHQYTNIAGDNKLPAWTLVNIGLAMIAGDNVVKALLVYRGALFGLHLVNLALAGWIAARLAPPRLATSLILFGWNPIVALQATSKSDTVMVCFLLLAVAALVFGRERLAVVPLVLSALVKLLTLPLGAVYAVRELRQGDWRRIAVEAVLAAGVVALLYLPFLKGLGLFRAHFELLGTEGSTLSGLPRMIAIAGALALIVTLGWLASDTVPRLLRSWLVVLLYFGLFLSRFSMAWYLMIVIALASVVMNWRFHALMVGLTASAFLVSTWGATSNSAFRLPSPVDARLAVYYTLPALVLAAVALPRLWRLWRSGAPESAGQ